jgi:hypothetical protein
MSGTRVAAIPHGYWADGACWREAELREPTGEDHRVLADEACSLPPAEWVTQALARCAARLGPPRPVTREAVRSLSVGDREALLLHLRRATAGDRLRCVVSCPRPECAATLDVDLRVSDLLLPPSAEPKSRHEIVFGSGAVSWLVRFRLPTGGDQEAVAALARTDLAAAVQGLLDRCVESVERADGVHSPGLPQELVEPLSAKMAELDPQAELTFHVTCAACGSTFATLFDAASYLIEEIRSAARTLDHEVHLLAYHYHWSPSEILGLTARERRRYLDLLEDELSRRSAG